MRHKEEERFHSDYVVHKIMRSFRKYTFKSCKGSCKGGKVKAKFVAFFFKEITFRLRYALGMRQLLYWAGAYAMHHGAMETICWFGMTYSVLYTSCLCLRLSSIDHLPSCESG